MNEHLMDAHSNSFDGDEWGNVMGWFFAVAHVLHHLDEVPEEWDYHHAFYCTADMRDPEDFTESEIVYLMNDCGVTTEDLISFGQFLRDQRDEELKAAGKAY